MTQLDRAFNKDLNNIYSDENNDAMLDNSQWQFIVTQKEILVYYK